MVTTNYLYELRQAAYIHLESGRSFVPVHAPKGFEVDKHPSIPTWKEYQSRYPNHVEIGQWFGEKSWHDGIAIVTGKISGIFALDVDTDKDKFEVDPETGELIDGFKTLRDLEFKHGELPKTPTVRTPRGGQHYIFRLPPEGIPNSTGNTGIGIGLDIRGDGGIVVAPPTFARTFQHDSYGFINDFSTPLADPPQWLIDLIYGSNSKKNHSYRHTKMPVEKDDILEGTRNDTLTRIAGTYWYALRDKDSVLYAILGVNNKRCKPPLEEFEVRAIVNSVTGYPLTIAKPPTGSRSAFELPRVAFPKAMDRRAYHGLLGEIAFSLFPQSEGSHEGIFLSLLTMFGNCIGNTPYVDSNGKLHTNEFIVLVGESAASRKSACEKANRPYFEALDPILHNWYWNCLTRSANSGEGILRKLRDPIIDDEGNVVVEGRKDPRLFIYLEEWSKMLTVLTRDGNTLEGLCNELWDSVYPVENNVVGKPMSSSDHHVSIQACVTKADLVKHLRPTQMANGFANRYNFVAVDKSQLLANGSTPLVDPELLQKLATVVEWATQQGRIYRSQEAMDFWEVVYKQMNKNKTGNSMDTLLGRGVAHITKFSLIFALADMSPFIEVKHIRAAMHVWDYIEDSTAYIFQELEISKDEERILQSMDSEGGTLTRSAVNDLFGARRNPRTLNKIRDMLVLRGFIDIEYVLTEGAKKKTEYWNIKTDKTDNSDYEEEEEEYELD